MIKGNLQVKSALESFDLKIKSIENDIFIKKVLVSGKGLI